MTKAMIARALQEKTELDKGQAKEAVEIFLSAIKEALMKGERVSIIGFGSFYVKNSLPRNGRNPRTGECIKISSKKVAKFKVGKEFREMVHELDPD